MLMSPTIEGLRELKLTAMARSLEGKGSVNPARRVAGHRLPEDVCCSCGCGTLT